MAPRSVPGLPGTNGAGFLDKPYARPYTGGVGRTLPPGFSWRGSALAERLMHANRQSDSTMLTVLIPAYNEADRIAETLDGVMTALAGAGMEGAQVLVIDDGSSDDTAAVAASRPGIEVFRLEGNRGKGGALNVGLRQARGKIIVTLDADLGASAAEMGCLLAPVFAGAEMTIAAFPAADAAAGWDACWPGAVGGSPGNGPGRIGASLPASAL